MLEYKWTWLQNKCVHVICVILYHGVHCWKKLHQTLLSKTFTNGNHQALVLLGSSDLESNQLLSARLVCDYSIIWFFKLNTSKKSTVDSAVIVGVAIDDWLVRSWAWGFLVAIVNILNPIVPVSSAVAVSSNLFFRSSALLLSGRL